MRVLLDQAAPVVGDIEGNAARCVAGIVAAQEAGARVVVAPELMISGYPPRDLLDSRDFRRRCRAAAEGVASATAGNDVIAVYGTPWCTEVDGSGPLHNVAVVAHQGRIVATVAKRLLPVYDVFDEARHFTAGVTPGRVTVDGLTLGVSVCEDLWNLAGFTPDPRYTVDPLAALGQVDLLVNLSGSPFHAGKGAERRALVGQRAAAAGVALLYCNQVGGNDHLLFDGGSLVADGKGRIVAAAPVFTTARLLVDLDAPTAPVRSEPGFAEEVFGALVMGVRDYTHRTGFQSAVLGLSGGIDSALVAVIAAAALGPENVWTVGMPGPYSSPGSLTDAQALATNLGTRFDVLPITPAWEQLRATLAPVVDPGGLTGENLQARVRGTVLMGLSNARGHLLLTTGNKSELATGYCTLYGDMNGALGVIGDVYKTDVYRLCRWINREGEVIPAATLTKPPSAELAPNQTDQDSLPPYEVLDALLRRYIDDGADPDTLIAEGHPAALVARVVGLVRRAEYKRWQAPPVLRVSRRAFGYGRRRPLAAR